MAHGKMFSELPPAAKGVLAVVATGVAVWIGYKIYQGIKKGQTLEGAKNEINKAKDEADKLNNNPATKAKLSPTQLAIYANSLFNAMDGYTSDEQAIYKVFTNVSNDADVLGIISAFGTREISSGTGNPEKNYVGSLGGALTSELDSKEMTALNNILAKKGIKYRF